MKQIYKEYAQPFLIEPTKLNSVVNKIHERLGDHAGTATRDSFEVFMSGNRRETLHGVEAVLALENSSRQRIQRLTVVSSSVTTGASRPEHEVQVDFGKVKATGDGRLLHRSPEFLSRQCFQVGR